MPALTKAILCLTAAMVLSGCLRSANGVLQVAQTISALDRTACKFVDCSIESRNSGRTGQKKSEYSTADLVNPYLTWTPGLGLDQIGDSQQVKRIYRFIANGPVSLEGYTYAATTEKVDVWRNLPADMALTAVLWGQDNQPCTITLSYNTRPRACQFSQPQQVSMLVKWTRVGPVSRTTRRSFTRVVGSTNLKDIGVNRFASSLKLPKRDLAAEERRRQQAILEQQRRGRGKCTGDPFSGACGVPNPFKL